MTDPYTLVADRVRTNYGTLTEALNGAVHRKLTSYRILHRGVVVYKRTPSVLEELRAAVRVYLAEHPDAELYQIAATVKRPEYLPVYGKFLVALGEIVRELREEQAIR